MVRDRALYDQTQAVLVDPMDDARQADLFARKLHGFARTAPAVGGARLLFAPPLSRAI